MNKLLTLFLGFIFAVTTTLGVAVQAQSPGMTITPALIELNAVAGQQLETSFTVTNNKTFADNERPSIEYRDFEPSISGEPRLLEQNDYKFGASNWLNGTLGLANLGDGQKNQIEVFVDVPNGTADGSYFSLVLVKQETNESSPTLTASVGGILIVNVGSSAPTAEIVRGDNTFVDEAANIISVELKNGSNHYFRPILSGSYSSTGGSSVSFKTLSFNEGGVFPGTNRVYTASLDGIDNSDGNRTYSVAVSAGGEVLASEDIAQFTTDSEGGTSTEDKVKEGLLLGDTEDAGSEVAAPEADKNKSKLLPFVAVGLLVLLFGAGVAGYFIMKGKHTKSLPPAGNPLFDPPSETPQANPETPQPQSSKFVPPPVNTVPPTQQATSIPAMPENPQANIAKSSPAQQAESTKTDPTAVSPTNKPE